MEFASQAATAAVNSFCRTEGGSAIETRVSLAFLEASSVAFVSPDSKLGLMVAAKGSSWSGMADCSAANHSMALEPTA